jgi:hypothetical protein
MKILFDSAGEMVVHSEGEKLVISIMGNSYKVEGEDLEFFSNYVANHKSNVEQQRQSDKSVIQVIKELWRPAKKGTN